MASKYNRILVEDTKKLDFSSKIWYTIKVVRKIP